MTKEVKEKWSRIPGYGSNYWASTNGEIRNNKGKVMSYEAK